MHHSKNSCLWFLSLYWKLQNVLMRSSSQQRLLLACGDVDAAAALIWAQWSHQPPGLFYFNLLCSLGHPSPLLAIGAMLAQLAGIPSGSSCPAPVGHSSIPSQHSSSPRCPQRLAVAGKCPLPVPDPRLVSISARLLPQTHVLCSATLTVLVCWRGYPYRSQGDLQLG